MGTRSLRPLSSGLTSAPDSPAAPSPTIRRTGTVRRSSGQAWKVEPCLTFPSRYAGRGPTDARGVRVRGVASVLGLCPRSPESSLDGLVDLVGGGDLGLSGSARGVPSVSGKSTTSRYSCGVELSWARPRAPDPRSDLDEWTPYLSYPFFPCSRGHHSLVTTRHDAPPSPPPNLTTCSEHEGVPPVPEGTDVVARRTARC